MLPVRVAAGAGAALTLPVATEPVVWDFLGYTYHPGPVIVGVCAVAITRSIVFLQTTGRRQVVLDVLVSLLCALVTALWVQGHDLNLLSAGISGIGIAGVGIGLISIAKGAVAGRMRAALDAFISTKPPQGEP